MFVVGALCVMVTGALVLDITLTPTDVAGYVGPRV